MLWQLKKISTGEVLNDPQPLPQNWGPIFGLSNFVDRLGDLSWVGMEDQGWFVVSSETAPTIETTPKSILEWERSKLLLQQSDWSMLSDVPMTKGQKEDWIQYRKSLREVRLQTGFPDSIEWPKKPD